MKLRLLVTEKCNRSCQKCANKGYDLSSLKVYTWTKRFESVTITGGEPMLFPIELYNLIRHWKIQWPRSPVYLYTAKTDDLFWMYNIVNLVNGITITLYNHEDYSNFDKFFQNLVMRPNQTFRLRYFDDDVLSQATCSFEHLGWDVKKLEWLDFCPLPENEVFMRLK